MMVMLPPYCYATGQMFYRVIEGAMYTDIAAREICGNETRPDHSATCRLRTENREVSGNFRCGGLKKVKVEWEIVCIGYNLKRSYRFAQG
jgi:transposase